MVGTVNSAGVGTVLQTLTSIWKELNTACLRNQRGRKEEKLTCDPSAVCRESMAIVSALAVCSGLEWPRTGHLTFWICCCFHIIMRLHMLVDKKWYLVLTYVCLLLNAVTHRFISSPCIFTSLWIVHVLASFFSWGFFCLLVLFFCCCCFSLL